VPGYASVVGARWDTVTFFAGSLFFTAASFLSYREAVDASPHGLNPAHRRFFTYQPGRIDWWATAVQFVDTLYFNVSCGVAMAACRALTAAERHVMKLLPTSTCPQIAATLNISRSTVKTHLQSIYRKPRVA
jgi:Bacterial regulatory proteins, luxR family